MRALFSKGILVLGVVLSVCAAVAEDAYVHSDGTQYIVTDYVIQPTTRVEMDMQLDVANTGGDQYFFGTLGDKTGCLPFCSYTAAAGKYCYCCRKDKSDWVTTTYDTSTDRRTIVMDGYHNCYSILENGVTNFTKSIVAAHDGVTSGVNMPIFCAYNIGSGGFNGKSKFKLFSCKIYEADELVRDFVPCVWGGEVGLRDLKNGKFFKPTGTNPLTYGGDILTGDDGYILSDGTQHIDSGYYATGSTRVEIDFAMVTPQTGSDQYIFGVNKASSGLMFGMCVTPTGGCCWNCKDGEANYGSFSVSSSTSRRTYVIDGYANTWSVLSYGSTLVSGTISAAHVGTSPYTLPIFGTKFNDKYSCTSKTAMRLYGFRIYEAGTLVRNYVPCVKGGVAGLKELESGLFYSDRSQNSSARLTAGGDVLRESDDPFVKGDGFQAFESGITLDSTSRIELDLALDRPLTGKSQYLFGASSDAADMLVMGAYIGSDDALGVNCRVGTANWQWIGKLSCAREKIVVDALNSNIQVYESNVLRYEANITAAHGGAGDVKTAKYTTPILANKNNSDEPSSITAAKIYSCKIYKNGELVNDFEPYVQDSVVGLRDSKTGNFITSPRNVKGFMASGDVPANVEEDAYLSSNQRQAINTGYYVNPNSCIEVDFALNQHTNSQERIFGATAGGDFPFGLYGNTTTATWGNFTFKVGAMDYDTQIPVDVARHRVIVDLKSKAFRIVTGSVTDYSKTVATEFAQTATWPMFLFGEPANAEGTTAQNLANVRIYSVKISENGALVHHYLPYCSGAVVGFKDVLTDDILTDALSSGEPFAVGCRGWGEDHAAFYEQPQGATISQGETAELSAFAPGAIAYQWLKDGEPVAGATGMTYEVSWQKKAPDAEYSVRADFSRYGVKVQSVSGAAKIANRPNGLIILFR